MTPSDSRTPLGAPDTRRHRRRLRRYRDEPDLHDARELRGDNKDEGGSLAFLALVGRLTQASRFAMAIVILGIFGVGLFYGDSMLTPAISVLSAVEGLGVIDPRSSVSIPGWAMVPMVVLATLATIVASQAVNSGAFSVTQQAIQVGYLPRLRVLHTTCVRLMERLTSGVGRPR